ncbi:MAG: hypothetical protein V7784_15265 [Oceanospirillaceae bacterium]
MFALIALIFIGIWMLIIHGLSYSIVKYLVPEGRRVKWYFGLFVFFMFGTFADEFLDQYQSREMCKPENLLIFDPEKVRGKTVVLRGNISREILMTPVIANVSNILLEDIVTGELLITYKRVFIKGGWLSHLIGFNSSSPLTYDGDCTLVEYKQLFQEFNVNKIYR